MGGKEGLEFDEKVVNALIYVSDGDLRKLTNVLQSCAMNGERIKESDIYDISAKARPKEIAAMLKYAVSGNFMMAKNELDSLFLRHGMSGEDILIQCYKEIQNLNIDEKVKLKAIMDFGETNFRIVEGANERIQLEAMLAGIALYASEKSR